ncbi:MAG: AraC family transcriptional regulator ligand-binding domain-containing protein [Bacteroidota bacterium]
MISTIPKKRADFETSCRAWELAVKMTGDRQLGLHIGQSTNPSIMGLVGYLMQNSKTLLDAFRQVCEYGRIATNMFEYKIIEKKDEVILQYTPVAIWQRLYPGRCTTGSRSGEGPNVECFLPIERGEDRSRT